MSGDAVKEALIAALTALAQQRRSFDEAEQATVEAAREARVTWEAIGECYGISRQAASMRFRQRRSHRAGR